MTLAWLGVFVLGVVVGRLASSATVLHAQEARRVFELRTYVAHEGKLADLQTRFRTHTTTLFEKHGITNIGYWVPQDAPASANTLVYLLAYPNREEAKTRWAAFVADSAWQQARAASEVNGKLVAKVESVFLEPTAFSPLS